MTSSGYVCNIERSLIVRVKLMGMRLSVKKRGWEMNVQDAGNKSATILFHPTLRVIDAARIAREQGGRLVWRGVWSGWFAAKAAPTKGGLPCAD